MHKSELSFAFSRDAMPKVILPPNYLRDASLTKLDNYACCISMQEGVEMMAGSRRNLFATA